MIKKNYNPYGISSPANKGKSCPAPVVSPPSGPAQRRKNRKQKGRSWGECATFGQKVAHVAKQIPKLALIGGVGLLMAKGLKKKK